MPLDQYEDDDDKPAEKGGARAKEFNCPECSASNPYDDGFGDGDEVRCYYCGLEFKAELRDDGKFKFREV